MYKLLSVIYISLLLFNIVKSYNQGNPLLEDVKLSKHHNHHKTRSTLRHAANKTSNNSTKSNSIEELIDKVNRKQSEKHDTDNAPENIDEHITEDNLEINKYSPKPTLTDDLTKPQQISADESNTSSEDYSDFYDSVKKTSTVRNLEDLADNTEHSFSTDEVSIHTPYRQNSVTQDAVLDLKGRSGYHRTEEVDLNDDMNLPSIRNFPEPNTYLKSGYVPSNQVDKIVPPVHNQNGIHPINNPASYSNDQPSLFNNPNNARSEMLYNNLLNSRTRYGTPLFYESISSREMLYPLMNSHELWAQGNTGQRPNSDMGFTQPGNQIYNSRYRDGCPKCTRRPSFPENYNIHRQAAETSHVLQTADGRSVEFDPSGANAYPLVQEEDAKSYRNQVQNTKANDVNHFQVSSVEFLSPVSQETHTSQEAKRNFQSLNSQTEPGVLSKLLVAMPSHFPRSSAALMRRVGLGGLPRFVI